MTARKFPRTCIFFLMIYFWLYWVFVAFYRLSVVAASRGDSSSAWLLITVASLAGRAHAVSASASVLAAHRLSSCGAWA